MAPADIVAAFGCILGVVPHMVAAMTGLAAILHASAIAFQAIKWLGVAYLLYLAWQTLQDQSAIQVEDNRAPLRRTPEPQIVVRNSVPRRSRVAGEPLQVPV